MSNRLWSSSSITIQNWYLGFDYNNSITNIWNAEVSSNEGNQYVIKNVGWNQDIAAGNSIQFGISGDHSFRGFPENYELIGTSAEVTEDDYAIQYIVDGDWGTGFFGSISVTNNTDSLTSDKETAKSYLTTSYFRSSGGTSMYTAINSAFSLYETTDKNILKMMVVLSDGVTSYTSMHPSVVTTANNKGVKIYTVGLGSSSSSYFTQYLKPLANNTAGAFYLASDASKLEDIYKDINKKIDIETDSDNDGIADYYEENMVMFNGITIKMNKNNPDSDGDGLVDGEEVAELNYQYNADKTQVIVTGKLISNPLMEDTDGDGLSDEVEITIYGTSPMSRDTDKDGLTDKFEIDEWYNPLLADEDGDGRLDYQEYVEGTSPRSFDKIWQDYVWEFVCGFIAGDIIHETDNVATVMGQITGSLVPGVDIRDVAANLAYGDYGFALLSMIGLWTGGGDAAKAGGTVIKFVIKNADNLPMMINLFEGLMKNFPDLVADLSKNEMFTEMVERLAKADTSKLTKSEAETYEQFLRKAGVSEDIIKGGSKVVPNIGFDDFASLKKHMGDPGDGNAWHHIVEQSQIGKRANFDANQVHNVNNIIAIPTGADSIHSKISAYYSSKFDFTNGLTVRDWLAAKSFDEQFEYGKDLLEEYGEVIATDNGWIFKPY